MIRTVYKSKIQSKSFCFVLISALLFLISPHVSFSEDNVAITVNGYNIYKSDYDYALSRHEDSYKSLHGSYIDDETKAKIKKELTEDLINKQLYMQEARRRGITARVFADEEEIEELMIMDLLFYTDGKFDDKKYKRYIIEGSAEIKSHRDKLETLVLGYKTREVLPLKVIAAMREDVSLDDPKVADEYKKQSEMMRAKYIKVDTISMANNIDISDDEIRSYYNGHIKDLRRPSQKKFAVLFFDPDEYKGMVSVSMNSPESYYMDNIEKYRTKKLVKVVYSIFRTKDHMSAIQDTGVNLKKYYLENIDKFLEPAEARIRLLSMKKPADTEKLRSLENDLKGGLPFSELFKKYSDDPFSSGMGGDLGYIKEGTLKEPFNGIAFGLIDGGISNIIETESGFYLVSAEQKKDERIKPFSEVEKELENEFLRKAAKPAAYSDAKKFRINAIRSGFEKAADLKGKTVYETGYFGIEDKLSFIGASPLFIETALALTSGEVSEPIEYDAGFIVLEVESLKPQEYLPYTDVAANVEKDYVIEKSSLFAKAAAEQAITILSSGATLEEITNRMKVHISYYEAPATAESPVNLGKITAKNDGLYLTAFIEDVPSYTPELSKINNEVANCAALYKAERQAKQKAEEIFKKNISLEGAAETPYFSRGDYVIDNEYMKPFIENIFQLKEGEKGIVKNINRYYVVQVLEKGDRLSGYENKNDVIKSQVLGELRDKYVSDWLKKERDRSLITVNI